MTKAILSLPIGITFFYDLAYKFLFFVSGYTQPS
jgi:hypothetical protein